MDLSDGSSDDNASVGGASLLSGAGIDDSASVLSGECGGTFAMSRGRIFCLKLWCRNCATGGRERERERKNARAREREREGGFCLNVP